MCPWVVLELTGPGDHSKKPRPRTQVFTETKAKRGNGASECQIPPSPARESGESKIAIRGPKDPPRSPQERPRAAKRHPRAAKSDPRAAKSGPRAAKSRPRAAKSAPRVANSGPREPPERPTAAEEPKKRPKSSRMLMKTVVMIDL